MPASRTSSLAAVPLAAENIAPKSSARARLLRGTGLRSLAIRYGIAALLAGIALVASLGIQPLFAFPYPFLFLFFGAVMVSAWIGGMGAGLFAVLLSTLV